MPEIPDQSAAEIINKACDDVAQTSTDLEAEEVSGQ